MNLRLRRFLLPSTRQTQLVTCCLALTTIASMSCTPGVHRPASPLKAALHTWPQEGSANPRASQIATFSASDSPTLTTITRSGDPAPAMSLTVAVDASPFAAVALATIAEQRMRMAGAFVVDTRVHRQSYELRVLALPPADPTNLVQSLKDALHRPVSSKEASDPRMVSRLEQLQLTAEAPSLLPYLQCTGELRVVPSDFPKPRSDKPTVEQLNRWMRTIHVVRNESIGIVGSPAFCNQFKNALSSSRPWRRTPVTSAAITATPIHDTIATYPDTRSRSPRPRLHLAVHFADPLASRIVTHSDTSTTARLVDILSSYGNWSVEKITSTTSPHGSCLAARLVQTTGEKTNAREAAELTALWQHTITSRLASTSPESARANVVRSILREDDPRDVGTTAAWWALAGRCSETAPRWTSVVSTPPPHETSEKPSSSSENPSTALTASFRTSIEQALQTWHSPAIKRTITVEPGQGQFWMLAASPCHLNEGLKDSGWSALAAAAAALSASSLSPSDTVSVQPWISADGVGIIAHGHRAPHETKRQMALRVADHVGRAISQHSLAHSHIAQARTRLLNWLGTTSWGGPVAENLCQLLTPAEPSALLPWGFRSAIFEAPDEPVSVRWEAAMSGPLKVAIIANESEEQGEAAAAELDNWISHRISRPRTCSERTTSAQDGSRPPDSAAITVRGEAPRVVMAFRLNASCPPADLSVIAASLQDSARAWATPTGVPLTKRRPSVTLIGASDSPTIILSLPGNAVPIASANRALHVTMTSWRQGGIPSHLYTKAAQEALHDRWRARATPAYRLQMLWRGSTETNATPTSVRACLGSAWPPKPLVTLSVNQLQTAEASPSH